MKPCIYSRYLIDRIEDTQQNFQPREKRGILKELECLNDQELIKRENNIIKEALESIFFLISTI